MKLLPLLLILACASALALDKPVNPLGFQKLKKYEKYDGNKTYYCHLDSVYVGFKERHYEDYNPNRDILGTSSSKTIVWNQDKNRPYRCEEFIELREELMSKYISQYEEYESLAPTPKPIGPRSGIR